MTLESKEQKERKQLLVLEEHEIAVYRTMEQQVKRLPEMDRIITYHLPNLINKATPPTLAKALREADAKLDIERRTNDTVGAWCNMSGAIQNGPAFLCIPHELAEKLHDIADVIDGRLAQLIDENGGNFCDDRMTAFPHLIAASEMARARAERLEAQVGKVRRSECSGNCGTATIDVTTRTMEEQRKVAEAAKAARAERERKRKEFNKHNAPKGVQRAAPQAPAKDLNEEVRERTAARIAEITG